MANTPDNGPQRRVVLLGASNLTRGLPQVLGIARAVCGGPPDVLAALGGGRSYGLRKSLLGRELPGIRGCGLWNALEERPPAPTLALVTDIGNDLLYEVPPDEVTGWVDECVGRLQRAGATVVMTVLPTCNVQTVSPALYASMRTVCFPRCRIGLAAMAERVLDLDARLRDLVRRRNLTLAEHRPEWYGIDPFHIRWRCRPAAWRTVLSGWSEAALPAANGASLWQSLRLRLLAPEQRWFFGWERRRVQPAGRLPDGTTLSLY